MKRVNAKFIRGSSADGSQSERMIIPISECACSEERATWLPPPEQEPFDREIYGEMSELEGLMAEIENRAVPGFLDLVKRLSG